MIISESSLDDLNNRLEKKVAMTNFRPNITISGCTPYDEVNSLKQSYANCSFFTLYIEQYSSNGRDLTTSLCCKSN